MDEDDAVALTLLEIGGRHQHADVQAGQPEQHARRSKPGNQLAGKGIKGGGGSETVEVEAIDHSRAIFKAAADAQGAKPMAAVVMAASNDRCPSPPRPDTVASTAPAPNINTGM